MDQFLTNKKKLLLCLLFMFQLTNGINVAPSTTNVSLNSTTNVTLAFTPTELSIELGDKSSFNISMSEKLNKSVAIVFHKDGVDAVELAWNCTFGSNSTSVEIPVRTIDAGHITITASTSADYIDTTGKFVNIQVYRSPAIEIISIVVGWIYFVLWTVSFYPQVCENFKRKSVVGLNLDFLVLNVLGHMSYNFFNVGLFWIPSVQREYFKANPHGVNPVQPNDIGFSMHAVFASSLTLLQACIYERGDQRISTTCRCLLALMLTFLGISLILSIVEVITWLDYLYYFSYLKLLITLLKSCPQAYLNFKRKSTIGWSIGNVLMDFCGGFLSIVQMFMISYNFNDWSSIFGDPTKFGLGLFSVMFDILFIVQHYILYRQKPNLLIDANSRATGFYNNGAPREGYVNEAVVDDDEIAR